MATVMINLKVALRREREALTEDLDVQIIRMFYMAETLRDRVLLFVKLRERWEK